MRTSWELLQDLQDAYASLYDLTILITNSEGVPITNASGETPLSKLLFDHKDPHLPKRIGHFIDTISGISKPIIYESHPGLKLIVAPVTIRGKIKYYIWAGVIIEKGTCEHIKEYFDIHLRSPLLWKEALDKIAGTTTETKQELVRKIEKMAENVSALLTSELNEREQRRKMDLMNEISTLFDMPHVDIKNVLSCFKEISLEIDFIGMARKIEDERFSVSEIVGACDGLAGTTFSTGEGFLGQVAATGLVGYWDNIDKDPRSLFFASKEIHPKLLFCFPIRRGDEVYGLLFGGNYSGAHPEQDILDLGQIMSKLLGMYLINQSLQKNMDHILLRLSTLMEVCQVMNVVKDLRRILFILVDMSLNLVQGPFACAVLKAQEDGSKVQIVSRGMKEEQIDQYSKDVAKRYFLVDNRSSLETDPPFVYKTEWGMTVLECPLAYSNEILGILCVAILQQHQIGEIKALLSSLAVMGGVAIKSVRNDKLSNDMDNLVSILHRTMGQWNPQAYDLTGKAKELAVSFARHKGLSSQEILDIAHACLLAKYDVTYLKEIITKSSIMDVMKDYQDLMKDIERKRIGIRSYNVGAKILALVYTYLSNDEKIDSISQLAFRDPLLRDDFISFLSMRQVIDREIPMYDSLHSGKEDRDLFAMRQMKEVANLTAREQDVLYLVIKGLSNREIAEKLFISEHTVKNHLTNIFQKIGVADRVQAISKVYQTGFGRLSE